MAIILHAQSHSTTNPAQGATTTVNVWCLVFNLAEMDDFPKSLFARCVSWAVNVTHFWIIFGDSQQSKCMVNFRDFWCNSVGNINDPVGFFNRWCICWIIEIFCSLTLECMTLSFLGSHTSYAFQGDLQVEDNLWYAFVLSCRFLWPCWVYKIDVGQHVF